MDAAGALRAELRRGARASSSPRPRRPASTSQSHAHPLLGRDGEALAMDVVRDGAADARALLIVSSACHGVEGFCGSGVQVALLRDAAWHAAAARRRRRGALRACAQPLRLLVVAAHDARERRPEPQLPRLQRSRCRPTRPTTSSPRCWCRRPGRPRPRSRPRIARYIAEHGLRGAAGGDHRRPVRRTRKACSTAAATRPGATSRCATCCSEHGARCARLGWIDLHTGLGPSGVGERIFAGRDDAAALARARAWWGDEVTSIYDGSSTLGAADRA